MKFKKRDGLPPLSKEELIDEWKDYFSSLLNNDSGLVPSEIPTLADEDLPICTDPPPPLPVKKHRRQLQL